jgi:hypothetical protein
MALVKGLATQTSRTWFGNIFPSKLAPTPTPTPTDPPTAPRDTNPHHVECLKIFHSARAIFCAPSNPSTAVGMYHETIRATPSWNRGEIPGPRYDCIFVSNGESLESNMSGLLVARTLRFFSFVINGELHQCALVHWFSIFGDRPDPDNGMWVVTPDYFGSAPSLSVIHIDSIFRAAHLLPIFRPKPSTSHTELHVDTRLIQGLLCEQVHRLSCLRDCSVERFKYKLSVQCAQTRALDPPRDRERHTASRPAPTFPPTRLYFGLLSGFKLGRFSFSVGPSP